MHETEKRTDRGWTRRGRVGQQPRSLAQVSIDLLSVGLDSTNKLSNCPFLLQFLPRTQKSARITSESLPGGARAYRPSLKRKKGVSLVSCSPTCNQILYEFVGRSLRVRS